MGWINYTREQSDWLSKNRKLVASEYHRQFCETFKRFDVRKDNLVDLRKRRGWRTGKSQHNSKKIGETRLTDNGYTEIKVGRRPLMWKRLHILIWEEVHGKKPAGHFVIFTDGDRTNICIENLQLVTKAEHQRIGSLRPNKKPAEVRPTLIALAKLLVKTQQLDQANS